MDDLILKGSVIDAMKRLEPSFSGSILEQAIKSLPSAQRKGKWIYPTDIKGFGRCPHCKALWDYSLISNPFFKFCPRCGNGENEFIGLKGEKDENNNQI